MLPPILQSTLQENPQFAQLYRHLTTNILAPDGSMKPSPQEAQERKQVAEVLMSTWRDYQDLVSTQTTLAQIQLLQQSLPYAAINLPPEIQDYILLISTPLPPHLQPQQLSSILPPPESLPLEELLINLSTRLFTIHKHLSALAADPPTSLLSADEIAQRKKKLERDKTEVDKGRIQVAELAGEVVGLQRDIAESTVRVLEEVKFGSVTRGVVAEAGFLAKLAEGMGEKLRVQLLTTLSEIYTPEVINAIANYHSHLNSQRAELLDRERRAKRLLSHYEDEEYEEKRGKQNDLQEIADRYARLKKEAEGVRGDIMRLKGKPG